MIDQSAIAQVFTVHRAGLSAGERQKRFRWTAARECPFPCKRRRAGGARRCSIPCQVGFRMRQSSPSSVHPLKDVLRASWVTRELLEGLLPAECFDRWADAGRDSPRSRRTRSVLRRPSSFVALVQEDREYVRLVNRSMLLEEIAASLGEEPDSN